MVSGPIPSWQIDGETVETMTDFILGGSKITAVDDCSYEIKRCLLPERKVTAKLDRILLAKQCLCFLIWCLGWSLEKPMAPLSSTLAWKIPWTEEPGGLQSMGHKESDTTERLHVHFSLSCMGEGNGNPLQCFCLEKPRDGGAWWAAIYGIAQSQTRLKWLSSNNC